MVGRKPPEPQNPIHISNIVLSTLKLGPLPFQEEGPDVAASPEHPEGVEVDGAQPSLVEEVAGRPQGWVELYNVPRARAGLSSQGRDEVMVEAHGGLIWAESGGPGLGARFTFTLPASGRFVHSSVCSPSDFSP